MRRNKQSKYLSFKLQSRPKLMHTTAPQSADGHAHARIHDAWVCKEMCTGSISVEAIDNLDDLGVEPCGRNGCSSSWTFDHQRLWHVPLVRSSVGE